MKLAQTEVESNGLVYGKLPYGSQLVENRRHRDSRGSFTEVFCQSWGEGIRPEQWSLVESRAGSFRGMHLHMRHDEYFSLASGHCFVGLRDLRPDSPSKDVSCLVEFRGSVSLALIFPRGVLHGWYFQSDSVHLQATSEEHATYGNDDNLGCLWSDPALDIPWPGTPDHVSERANNFPSLAKLLDQIGLG